MLDTIQDIVLSIPQFGFFLPYVSSENFPIRFWRQYMLLFASMAAVTVLIVDSRQKSSRCILSLTKLTRPSSLAVKISGSTLF